MSSPFSQPVSNPAPQPVWQPTSGGPTQPTEPTAGQPVQQPVWQPPTSGEPPNTGHPVPQPVWQPPTGGQPTQTTWSPFPPDQSGKCSSSWYCPSTGYPSGFATMHAQECKDTCLANRWNATLYQFYVPSHSCYCLNDHDCDAPVGGYQGYDVFATAGVSAFALYLTCYYISRII